MRDVAGLRLSLGTQGRGSLCALGLALVVTGIAAHTPVPTVLIVVGSANFAVGLLLPQLTEFEIGPGGLKTKLAAGDGEFRVVFAAEADRLHRFAFLMCGDWAEARTLVEEALGKTRQQQRHIPADERGNYALRALLDFLATSQERRWLRGPTVARANRMRWRRRMAAPHDVTIPAKLAELDLAARAAFLLRFDWSLSVEEVAYVLRRPVEEVCADIERGRELVKSALVKQD